MVDKIQNTRENLRTRENSQETTQKPIILRFLSALREFFVTFPHRFINWFKPHRVSAFGYIVWFCIFTTLSVIIMQWAVNLTHPVTWPIGFVLQIFKGKLQFFNNFMIMGLIYAILLMIINRFWATTTLFLTVTMVAAIADRMKVMERSETIAPSDLSFVSGGNTGNLLSFIPDGSMGIIIGAVAAFVAMIVLTILLTRWDKRRGIIASRAWYIAAGKRLLVIVLCGSFLTGFTYSMSTTDSWANKLAYALSDSPKLWNSVWDAQANGTVVGFARFINPKIMTKPSNYSKATMQKILKRYTATANKINASRTANMTDSTVIFVLSESFSDPSRVPGISLNKDVMPYIRSVKSQTTSGLMLSSGYGGGTANIEYMALTGLSMVNFDASLSSPYQQLVPSASWTPTINQLWSSGANSFAFHPYTSSMYSRRQNYKKFKFTTFSTLDTTPKFTPTKRIDRSPYVSDESSYTAILNKLKSKKSSSSTQFLQLVTMQNHMNYNNWYKNNEVKVTSTTGTALGDDETTHIKTYAKGVEYTDTATKEFLEKLDAMNKPITVVFYGDHLPGAYATASKSSNNSLALHETDYFIWSNKASSSANTKLSGDETAYTSPNYFMAQAAEHMNAKVSPYIAFLTALHKKVPAMEPAVVNKIQGWSRIPEGQALYLNSSGERVDISKADKATKQLLADYKLIQYDITAGKNYLKDTSFMTLSSA